MYSKLLQQARMKDTSCLQVYDNMRMTLDKPILWPCGNICMSPDLHHKALLNFGAYRIKH